MRTRHLLRLTAVLAVVALIAVACNDDDNGTAEDIRDDVEDAAGDVRDEAEDLADDVRDTVMADHTITIENFAFDRGELTISAGDTVTFRNDDTTDHAVVSSSLDGETYEEINETVPAGEAVDITFDEAGTYEYYCQFHDSMTGTIIVE